MTTRAPCPRQAHARRTACRSRRHQRLELETLENRWLPSASAAYAQLPLSFEANQGQADPRVDFLSRGSGYTLFLTDNQAVLALQPTSTSGNSLAGEQVLDFQLLGASSAPTVIGQDRLPGVSNYFIGNDPSRWHTNIPNYAQVQYQNVYPGIDLLYHGGRQQLEYDFVINPGAHPGAIRMTVNGATSMSLDANGDLVLHTTQGDVVEKSPLVYQLIHGKQQAVAGRYVLQNGAIGFAVGAYDSSLPLVIDPVLEYSTYLGGSNQDAAAGIVLAGDIYLAGTTLSTDFPTVGPVQGAFHGGTSKGDVFVARLNAAGTALVFSTYLGGSADDFGTAVAFASLNGDVLVTGGTASSDFPTVNAMQPAYLTSGGKDNAFVAELNNQGNALVYSTYLGGTGNDVGLAIASDHSNNAYVTGSTSSTDFLLASPLQSRHAADGGQNDAFVTVLNPAGTAPIYSTYLGGSGNDVGTGIALDTGIDSNSVGNAYVSGWTTSTDFPVLTNLQRSHGADSGGADAFVAKLNPSGTGIDYSTYFGGSGNDKAYAIAVDASGAAYVTGTTSSTNFPTVNAFQTTLRGSSNAFVTKLSPAGNLVIYSSYFGGSGTDQGNGIAVDSSGNAYLAGATSSSDFPTTNAPQSHKASVGGTDAFVAKVGASGTGLAYSTYLGGTASQSAAAIAVDQGGNAFVTGQTSSTNFPTTAGVLQSTNHGLSDAFLAELGHLWQGQDVAVGSDDKTRLLWSAADGGADTWTVDNSLVPTPGPAYGVFTGWSAVATAAGGNGLTWVLWDNISGAAALWEEDASGNFVKAGYFSPPSFVAQDIAVGSDNLPRILWAGSSSAFSGTAMMLWTIDSSFNFTSGPTYQASANSGVSLRMASGPDGRFRVAGQGTVFVFDATGTQQQTANVPVGSITDIAVGPGNQTYLMAGQNGAVFLWLLNTSLTVTATFAYGAPRGWLPRALDVGSDGVLRLLWDNLDGTADLWLINASGTVVANQAYGPF